MATHTQFSTPVTTSAAQLNAYWLILQNFFTTLGWVQTSDTGQFDPLTNAATPALGAAYQMFRMNDSLQATAPVYLRLSVQGGGSPIFTVQIGTATDGAGTLTGTFTGVQQVNYNNGSTNDTVPYTCYGSGDSGRIWVAMNAALASSNAVANLQFFSVERSKDDDGVSTNEYVTLITAGATAATNKFQVLHYTAGLNSAEQRWPAIFPYSMTTGALGTGGGLCPIIPYQGKVRNPLMDVALVKWQDYPHLSNITGNTYGTERKYKIFGAGSTTAVTESIVPVLTVATMKPAIAARFE